MTRSTYTRKEIALAYNIDERTLRNWCKRNNLKLQPGLLCPRDLQLIFYTFGTPKAFSVNQAATANTEQFGYRTVCDKPQTNLTGMSFKSERLGL